MSNEPFDYREHMRHERVQRDRIELSLVHLHVKANIIMATLDDILANEADEASTISVLATQVQALLTTEASLQTQLATALSGLQIPPAVQAQIDAAFSASANNAAAVKAIIASLPAPAPVSTPTGVAGS